MSTKKIMFISSSEPLAEGLVRLSDGRVLQLDENGQLPEELGAEQLEVEVQVQEEWKTLSIDLTGIRSSLLVVDVNERHTGIVGSVLGGRYRIDAQLGAGGMGVVYRARDLRLGRDVAIKTLSEQFRSNEVARRLFLEEARAMATLSHPNLASIHDVGTFGGIDLMVTEFVEGQNLEEWVNNQGPFQSKTLVEIGLRLCEALAFLHQSGVIHRDIKPANAIMDAKGEVRLIDFGLARSLEDLIVKGTAIRGTPAYMAPEQIKGGTLNEATDVYQLGVTLFELATGQLPIDVGQGSFLAIVTEEPESVAVYWPEIPESLQKSITACMSKDPGERPTIEEVRFLFEALLKDEESWAEGSPTVSLRPKKMPDPLAETFPKMDEDEESLPVVTKLEEEGQEGEQEKSSLFRRVLPLALLFIVSIVVVTLMLLFNSGESSVGENARNQVPGELIDVRVDLPAESLVPSVQEWARSEEPLQGLEEDREEAEREVEEEEAAVVVVETEPRPTSEPRRRRPEPATAGTTEERVERQELGTTTSRQASSEPESASLEEEVNQRAGGDSEAAGEDAAGSAAGSVSPIRITEPRRERLRRQSISESSSEESEATTKEEPEEERPAPREEPVRTPPRGF